MSAGLEFISPHAQPVAELNCRFGYTGFHTTFALLHLVALGWFLYSTTGSSGACVLPHGDFAPCWQNLVFTLAHMSKRRGQPISSMGLSEQTAPLTLSGVLR